MNLTDLILIAVFLLIVFEGYLRGFIVSVLSLARVAVGVPLSYSVAKNLSEPLYNSVFRETFSNSLTNSIDSSGLESVINGVRESVGNMPESLKGNVSLSFLSNVNAGTATQAIMENVVDPIAIIVCKMVVFLLALAVYSFLSALLLAVIKRLTKSKHALFKKTNKFLGAALGAVKALIIVFALAAVGRFFIVYFGAGDSSLIRQLEGSAVIELINKFNPLLII